MQNGRKNFQARMNRHNPFWEKSQPAGPIHSEARSRKEEEKSKITRKTPSTLFDLEQYFIDTHRGYFITDISDLKKDLLERELMHDLANAKELAERDYIRKLILILETEGFPNPDFNINEIIKFIHGRIRILNWEYARRSEAGDDTTNEEEQLDNWRKIISTLFRKKPLSDESLLFIEEALRDMQKNAKYFPQNRYIRNIYKKLRQVRNASYHKSF